MGKFPIESFYILLLILVLGLALNMIYLYIKGKKSGNVIYNIRFKKSYLNIAIWIALALLWLWFGMKSIFKGYGFNFYNDGIMVFFWIVLISTQLFKELQKRLITEGGIIAEGQFWPWEDVDSYKWYKDKDDNFILIMNAKSHIFFVNRKERVQWVIERDEQINLDNILKVRINR